RCSADKTDCPTTPRAGAGRVGTAGPQRRPGRLRVRALGPLDNQDRIEIARRLEEHQRLLRDILPDLRGRPTRAEGGPCGWGGWRGGGAVGLGGVATPPRPG